MWNSNVNTNRIDTRHTVYMPVRLQDVADNQLLNLLARIYAVWSKKKETQPTT